MNNKLYDKLKSFISESYKSLVVFLIILISITIPLPYYVNTPGGVLSVNEKIKIDGDSLDNDYFNLSYVLELKGTIPNLIIAKFNKNWDIIKKSDVIPNNESDKDVYFRDHLLLEEANQNAIIVAYNLANFSINIKNRNLYVTYIDEEADTDLKVGDEIISVNGVKAKTKEELADLINNSSSDRLSLMVKKNDEKLEKYALIRNIEGLKKIGILITEKKEIITTPKVSLMFDKSETGPSGGLIMALAIYNDLTGKNITKGERIAGTGTIDENGFVGSISGVPYKIKGAVKAKIKTFLVPAGKNYEEAVKVKEENNYNIEVVPIKHIEEALEYFKK